MDPTFRLAVLGLGRYSGAGTISLHLTKELALRVRVLAVISEEALNLSDWTAASETHPFELIVKPTYGSSREAILHSIFARRIFGIAQAIRNFSPNAILVPMTHFWILPIMWVLRSSTWVVVIHDPFPHPGRLERLMNVLDRLVARNASAIVTHTKRFVPVVADSFGIDIDRVSNIPLGPLSDLGDLRSSDQRARNVGSEPYVVLCFGRIEAYKGIEVLLRAAPLVEAKRPDIMIRIVGRGAEPAIVAAAAACPNVSLDTRWVEESEIASIFQTADLLVLPYTSATQSGVIPHAATFGLPVICTDVGGLAEQLDDGRCGILIPPNDPQSLADAILRCSYDPSEARRLGEALRFEYAENRSWSKIATQFVDVAKHAAKSRRRNKK
jgi:glycosyltransferase involved in cell wall biosynthesis